MNEFEELGLSKKLSQKLKNSGFKLLWIFKRKAVPVV
jgi:superfamily II DNA/RNA helicase